MLKSFTFLNLLTDLPPVGYNLMCLKRGRGYWCLALRITECSLPRLELNRRKVKALYLCCWDFVWFKHHQGWILLWKKIMTVEGKAQLKRDTAQHSFYCTVSGTTDWLQKPAWIWVQPLKQLRCSHCILFNVFLIIYQRRVSQALRQSDKNTLLSSKPFSHKGWDSLQRFSIILK